MGGVLMVLDQQDPESLRFFRHFLILPGRTFYGLRRFRKDRCATNYNPKENSAQPVKGRAELICCKNDASRE